MYHFKKPTGARTARPGMIRCCRPTLALKAPSGPLWRHEIKIDGYRLLADKRAGRSRLLSRAGTNLTEHFKSITAALDAMPHQDILLDGEAVIFDANGHSSFSRLRSRDASSCAQMVVFDILVYDNVDIRQLAWRDRQAILDQLDLPPSMIRSEVFEEDGQLVYEHACRLGLEGIVSKRVDKTYRSGPSPWWQKVKNPEFKRS